MAYTEMDQTKYHVSSMFAFGCIIWILLHLFTCTYSGWLISDDTIIGYNWYTTQVRYPYILVSV